MVKFPPGKIVYVTKHFDTQYGGNRPCGVGEILVVIKDVDRSRILVWRESIPEGESHHLNRRCWWISKRELEENTTADPAEVALLVLAV